MSSNPKKIKIIEFSTNGPALAFTCLTVGKIVRRIELDPKCRVLRNVGIAFEYTGV